MVMVGPIIEESVVHSERLMTKEDADVQVALFLFFFIGRISFWFECGMMMQHNVVFDRDKDDGVGLGQIGNPA